MPLVIPNTVLCRVVWGYGGAPQAVNVFAFAKKDAAPVTQAKADAVDAAIKSAHTSSGLRALQVGAVQLLYAGLRDISAPSLPEFIGSGPAQGGTQAAGKHLPPQIALVITLRTANVGKSYRGRCFVPFFGDSALDAGGTATAAASTAAKSFVDTLNSGVDTTGYDLAVASRKLLQSNLVNATQVRDLVWDTIQKRAVAGI
jgi:hypothetical protein